MYLLTIESNYVSWQLLQLIHHGGAFFQALNFTGMGGNVGVYEAYDT